MVDLIKRDGEEDRKENLKMTSMMALINKIALISEMWHQHAVKAQNMDKFIKAEE